MNIKHLIAVILLLAPLPFYGDGLETPRHITRIIEQLSCELPEEGTFVCNQLGVNRPLYIERQGTAVTQIGMRLFTKEMRKAVDEKVCNAIERVFLELALSPNTQKQKDLLKEYRISLKYNGFSLGMPQFPLFGKALEILTSNTSLKMNAAEGKIVLHAKSADDDLVVTLPADRELLFAYDKKEHEEIIQEELKHWNKSYQSPTLPFIGELELIGDNIYELPGKAYMIDSLKNTTYYTLDSKGNVATLFAADEPLKSLQNLLMGYACNNANLHVRYRTYEKNTKYCSMPLTHFLGYMQQQELKFYSAAYHTESQEIHCLLLMHHPIYDYIHMLIVKTDSTVFTNKQSVLEGDFYTFIPQHNIKSLFNF